MPKARGKSRSGDPMKLVEDAKIIASKGIKEIVLTGVNIGDYGKNIEQENIDFLYLLKKLDAVDGIERIRISSIEPNLITDEIIDFVSSSKSILPHFHIPLQSGSDRILKLMKRRYLTDLYRKKIETINNIIPHAGIGVDVIVGFPGETEDDFKDTYNFINSLDVSYLHVFTYSERKDTPAASMENSVPMNIRRERNEILTHLSDNKKTDFYTRFLNTNRKILAEKSKSNLYTGFTDNYIKVNLKSEKNIENEIVNVHLNKISSKIEVEANITL
ncbi:MAG: MiaB/RimO family radical SAM methylthiotransferase [Saprospiraceae bacterium]